MPSFPGSVRVPSGAERQFGDFTLLLKLGWGGMADVFLAKPADAPEDSFVVIKRLKADLAYDPDHRAMFEAEARLALRFDHPNVVRALGHGEIDEQPYLTLEYLEGQTLDRIIGEPGLARGEAIEIVRGLLAGLQYAHDLCDERGERLDVVHRDVSPHNVFVTVDGRVKLVDFGIAKSKLGSSQHTVTGVVKGKLAYMAPEQALANVVDRRADLFATGVVLTELLTCRRYWGALSDVQILKAMTFGELPKPAGLDADVGGVLAKALTVTPEARFASAAAFQSELAKLCPEPIAPRVLGAAVQRVARTDPESVRHLVRAQLAGAIPAPSPSSPGRVPPAPVSSPGRTLPTDSGPASMSEPESIIETTDGQALPLAELPRPKGGVRSRLAWIGAAAFALAATTLVIVRFANPPTSTASPTPDPRPASSAIGSAAAPVASLSAAPGPTEAPRDPRDQITVRVIASPASARIQLDGVDVAANPFVAKFPRDGAAHKLVVSAAGYTENAELVVFDRDVAIERRLVAAKPGALAPSSRPSASQGLPTGPHVDNRDPWAPRPK